MRASKPWCGWLVAAALVAAALPAWGQVDEPQPVERVEVIVQAEPHAPAARTLALIGDLAEDGPAASGHWIGVQLEPLTDTLKSQLNRDHGLVIAQVFPDSPAAKSDLKEHDILLQAGDAAIKEAGEILKFVGDNKDKEMSLTVLRGGKEMTIKVTPTKRPAQIHVVGRAEPLDTEKWEHFLQGDVGRQFHEAMRALNQANAGEKRALGMYFVHPGIVGDANKSIVARLHGHPKLPENVSININKDGDTPAKISVKRDGKTYEVTEDKIDELPEDLRGPVKQMLNKPEIRFRVAAPLAPGATFQLNPLTHKFQLNPMPQKATGGVILPHPVSPPQSPGVITYTPTAPQVQTLRAATPGHVEQKLDTILKKLDQLNDQKLEDLQHEVKQLRAELDELRKKRGAK